jgi:hypothetical protein
MNGIDPINLYLKCAGFSFYEENEHTSDLDVFTDLQLLSDTDLAKKGRIITRKFFNDYAINHDLVLYEYAYCENQYAQIIFMEDQKKQQHHRVYYLLNGIEVQFTYRGNFAEFGYIDVVGILNMYRNHDCDLHDVEIDWSNRSTWT